MGILEAIRQVEFQSDRLSTRSLIVRLGFAGYKVEKTIVQRKVLPTQDVNFSHVNRFEIFNKKGLKIFDTESDVLFIKKAHQLLAIYRRQLLAKYRSQSRYNG